MDDYYQQQDDDITEDLAIMAIAGYLLYRFGDNTAFCVGMYLLLWFISGTIVLPMVVLGCASVVYGIYWLCHM